MSRRRATARLFVAVDPPAEVRDALARWARTALRAIGARSGAGSPLRVLDPETLHVTLCFLGNQPVEGIHQIGDRLASISGSTCELSVGAPLWLPARRPRALAVELREETGGLERLHRELLNALREVCEPPDERHGGGDRRHRFRPHVTVARMRTGAAPRERTLAPTPALSFIPHELVLYRSWLFEHGASYEPLAGVSLE
jgi:RNA 2',3'-cyclic 3'-phosphodiesterase